MINKLTAVAVMCLFLSIISATGVYGQDQPKKEKPNRGFKEKHGGQKAGGKLSNVTVNNGNIVLGSPTNHSVTASVILEKNVEGYIEYSAQSGVYKNKTALFTATGNDPLEIVIKDLVPNTRYHYRLNYRDQDKKDFTTTRESWFATQRNPQTSFSFGVQGDSHPEREGKMFHPDLYRQTIGLVAEKKPDFYFLMGDDFNIDRLVAANNASRENTEAVYKVQRHYLGNAGFNPPLFLVNGNHEQAARYLLNGTPDNAAVQAGLARKKFFPLPGPDTFYSGDKDTVQFVGLLKDYYAFEWGNALFVVIDPYWHSEVPVDNQPSNEGEEKRKKDPWGATVGKVQYDWLKKTLETSKARFKFVFAHHVNGTGRGGVEMATYFEWGGYGKNGNWQFDRFRAGWEMPIHQLFVKNKVTIFFQGHDHIFAKQELDGVIYQSVPNPADDTYTAFNKEAYLSGTVLPNSGFLNVSVSSNEVKVEYIRSCLKENMPNDPAITQSYEYIIRK